MLGHAYKADRINRASCGVEIEDVGEDESGGGSEAQVFLSINMLMEKLEKLNETLDNMMNETRKANPIVGNVLAVATKAMGLAKLDKDYDNNEDLSLL